MGRRGDRGRIYRLVGGVALCAVVLGSLGSPHGVHPLPSLRVPPTPDAGTRNVSLAIAPTTWWMVSGNRTPFEATWTGVPADCNATPEWFRWSLGSGWFDGALSNVSDASAVFVASSVATGEVEVVVESASTLTCGASELALDRNATANVTVVVPPEVSEVTVWPDPISPGAWTNLTGTVDGGVPPYRVTVEWGDDSSSSVNLSAPGPFQVAHQYRSGNFTPAVILEDAAGLTAVGSVESPVLVSNGLAVAVVTGNATAEVGVPVDFTGAVVDPPPSFSELEGCTDGSSGPGNVSQDGPNVSFSCTFDAAGPAVVEFEVVPVGDDLPPARAYLDLPVVDRPALSVFGSDRSGEVGRVTVVAVRLDGGIPPYVLEWQLSGNATAGRIDVDEDGAFDLPLWPAGPGSFGLSAGVTDADGTRALNSSVQVSVVPAIRASASVLENGTDVVRVGGSVPEGAAPFTWFVAPAMVPSHVSAPNGTLTEVSGFDWVGVVPFEGNTTVTVGVVDADGGTWWSTLNVSLVPPLAVASLLGISVGNGTATVTLTLDLAGGQPPFEVWANASTGASGNATLSDDGTTSWSWTVNQSGPVTVRAVAVDSLGRRALTNASGTVPPLAVPPPPPPTPPPSSPVPPGEVQASASGTLDSAPLVAGLTTLGVALAGGVAFLWRRRSRRNSSPPPSPDPVGVLREIIEPADGADRATVELLAEERGVPLDTVRATLDRLIAEGTVASETGSDGEEVVAWSNLGS